MIWYDKNNTEWELCHVIVSFVKSTEGLNCRSFLRVIWRMLYCIEYTYMDVHCRLICSTVPAHLIGGHQNWISESRSRFWNLIEDHHMVICVNLCLDAPIMSDQERRQFQLHCVLGPNAQSWTLHVYAQSVVSLLRQAKYLILIMLVQCCNIYIWNTEKSSCLDWDSNHGSLDCRSTALQNTFRIYKCSPIFNDHPNQNYWGLFNVSLKNIPCFNTWKFGDGSL
jgi:hypothetical protein